MKHTIEEWIYVSNKWNPQRIDIVYPSDRKDWSKINEESVKELREKAKKVGATLLKKSEIVL